MRLLPVGQAAGYYLEALRSGILAGVPALMGICPPHPFYEGRHRPDPSGLETKLSYGTQKGCLLSGSPYWKEVLPDMWLAPNLRAFRKAVKTWLFSWALGSSCLLII